MDPAALPGGKAVLFTIAAASSLAPDSGQVAVIDLATGRTKVILAGADSAQFAEPGFLIYHRRGGLWANRFDSVRFEAADTAFNIVEAVTSRALAADYALSENGTLAYVPRTDAMDTAPAATRTALWVDREGHEVPLDVPERGYGAFQVSPDGTRVAFDERDSGLNSIWIWDVVRQTLSRMTVEQNSNDNPVWMPDGKRIVFRSGRTPVPSLFVQSVDGTGPATQLTSATSSQIPKGISPNGQWVLFTENVRPGEQHILMVSPARGHQSVTPLVMTASTNNNPAVSPNGRWMAYQSDESGAYEVYVRPFPDVSGGRWQVSSSGGVVPLWSRDGRELFFADRDGYLSSVQTSTGDSFTAGAPRRVLNARYVVTGGSRTYDVAPDGRRFLMLTDESDSSTTITVVVNWSAEVAARFPR